RAGSHYAPVPRRGRRRPGHGPASGRGLVGTPEASKPPADPGLQVQDGPSERVGHGGHDGHNGHTDLDGRRESMAGEGSELTRRTHRLWLGRLLVRRRGTTTATTPRADHAVAATPPSDRVGPQEQLDRRPRRGALMPRTGTDATESPRPAAPRPPRLSSTSPEPLLDEPTRELCANIARGTLAPARLAVVAPGGHGKTAVLHHLARRCERH